MSGVLYLRVPEDIYDAVHRLSAATGLTITTTAVELLRRGLGTNLECVTPAERIAAALARADEGQTGAP